MLIFFFKYTSFPSHVMQYYLKLLSLKGLMNILNCIHIYENN